MMTQENRKNELKEQATSAARTWSEVDTDEQEYLDRVSDFGEGYFDFSILEKNEE
jgi:hypothetical protein